MTANNTGMQSTPMTPSLATPFMVLKNAEIPQSSQSAIPLKINNLIKQKQWDAALIEIEIAAKKNPKNVQLLFVKSRILIEKGQLEQARLTLLDLIEKYPELPEPYNNLAVLYANAGKLELARENLEMCLKLSPGYATALQNLGDVYTKIAAQHYAKAFQSNRRLSEAQRKQKLAEAITE
jgi:Flp pilus assembly protein TadD